jgi:hypothetical protein
MARSTGTDRGVDRGVDPKSREPKSRELRPNPASPDAPVLDLLTAA